MNKITMNIIPHDEQRYDTVGDYWEDETGNWHFAVSNMGNLEYEIAVFIHELVEKVLCKQAGITDEVVDAFDMAFDGDGDGEPGDELDCPYHYPHLCATNVEKLAIIAFKKEWKTYDECVMNLGQNDEKETQHESK